MPRKLKKKSRTCQHGTRTNLQNTKTFKDSKHKEHKPKPKPNPQSLANPEHHKKSNPPYKHQTQKQTHKFQTQIREIRKQTQKF